MSKQKLLAELCKIHDEYAPLMGVAEVLDGIYAFIPFILLMNYKQSKEKTIEFLTECHDQTKEKLKNMEIPNV